MNKAAKVATIQASPGMLINIDGDHWCARRWETSDSMLFENLITGIQKSMRLSEITYAMDKIPDPAPVDLYAMDEEDWAIAKERFRTLEPLLGRSDRVLDDVKAVAKQLTVSVPTVYRWLERIESVGTVTCLFRRRRSDMGLKRIDPEIDQVIREVLVEKYLTKLKRSPTKAYEEVKLRCRARKLPFPSKNTVVSRIEEILPEERERKRNGRNAALKFRPQRGHFPGAEYVHAVWQIDHTPLDIELVDEKDRIAIGKPWITLAIDVFSRMVVGWYISLDPPGALATGICIANAILPKDELLVKLGCTHLEWPCQGKPGLIHADNAKEFRGKMLQTACNEHQIDLRYRKVKKPNYGGHIERMLGTLLEEIHALEGTTFSNPQQKGEYDSAKQAIMTLDDLELWLANLVLGVYHKRKHSEIETAPIKRYTDGILGTSTTLGIGVVAISSNAEKLKIDFLPFEERTIQPEGVVLDWIHYHDPVLNKWIGARDPESKKNARKFIFRRDPRNISYLIFWDPEVRQYYRIPYRDSSRPAISLWELRAVKAFLTERGKGDIDENAIFDALSEMRRIEENAKTLTRKVRRKQERRNRHSRVPPPLVEPHDADEVDKTEISAPPLDFPRSRFDPSTIRPFDEIEE